MQNPKPVYKNTYSPKIFIENYKKKQKYVDINILLNRVKKKNLEEKKKKVLLFCIATLSVGVTGLIVF